MKGKMPLFIMVSLLGMLIGVYLIFLGKDGKSPSPFITLVIGIFFLIKEIWDEIEP